MTEITKPALKRPYRQSKRAAQAADTRQRIVEAAVALHGSVGPARTTISMIAARAGVQRHTFYAHFPDERELFLACSGLFLARDPMPDPAPWREIPKSRKRLKTGLGEIYAWYGRNAVTLASVLRDAEYHELTRETVELRQSPVVAAYFAVLGEGLGPRQMALLRLALSFSTWRSLTQESRLDNMDAVAVMAAAVLDGT